MRVLIIDSGSGNKAAISNVLKRLKVNFLTSNDNTNFNDFSHFILPGVGAFDTVMSALNERGISEKIKVQADNRKKKILGICVGMQVLSNKSEEGKIRGLGLINGVVKKFRSKKNFVIPHMGWNSIKKMNQSYLLDGIDSDKGFYFLHSYYFDNFEDADCITKTKYDFEFTSIVQKKNIYGVQFHPEKSHENGVNIFKNFLKL